jgi:hypothetical protein
MIPVESSRLPAVLPLPGTQGGTQRIFLLANRSESFSERNGAPGTPERLSIAAVFGAPDQEDPPPA